MVYKRVRGGTLGRVLPVKKLCCFPFQGISVPVLVCSYAERNLEAVGSQ